MKRAKKRNPAVWAMHCLRELEARGDMVRVATVVGVPAGGPVHPAIPQWKYASVERAAAFLESSIQEDTKWAMFEPNGEPLWEQIRLDVGAFMQTLFLQGAFQGLPASRAYFVKCDAENNLQETRSQGIVNITVGFAPLYPAEFVTIQISQMTGQPFPHTDV